MQLGRQVAAQIGQPHQHGLAPSRIEFADQLTVPAQTRIEAPNHLAHLRADRFAQPREVGGGARERQRRGALGAEVEIDQFLRLRAAARDQILGIRERGCARIRGEAFIDDMVLEIGGEIFDQPIRAHRLLRGGQVPSLVEHVAGCGAGTELRRTQRAGLRIDHGGDQPLHDRLQDVAKSPHRRRGCAAASALVHASWRMNPVTPLRGCARSCA